MTKWLGGAVVVLGVIVASSSAQAAPGWCAGAKGEKVDFNLDRALKGDETVWAIHDLVGAICFPDNWSTPKMGELEARRGFWSKKLEMNDADWSDAAAWATAQQSSRYPASMLTPEDPKKPWSTMDPIEQYVLLGYDIAKDFDANYIADALGAKLSEAGRLGYLLKACMSSRAKEVQWAMCQPDLDGFDFKKLVAEMRADKKHAGYDRFLIRLAAVELLPDKLKERAPEIKAARAKDPAYEKMFEISAKTRKEWDGIWKSDAALLDLLAQLDDARVKNSRSGYQGCEDKTWAAWKTAVSAIPAKKFGAVQPDQYQLHYAEDLFSVVANDVRGYLAGAALYTCGATDNKPDPVIRKLGEVMERWPGYRGPRTAAHTAILSAGLELDERNAKIDYPDTNRGWFSQGGGSSGGGSGTVASVKPQGDKVHVEFASKLEKQEQCLQSKRTNRVTQIRGDGSLVYESNCLKWGSVTIDRKSQPQNVKSRYGQGLRPGMGAFIIEDALIAAFPKPGSNTPSLFAGVPLK